LILLVFPFQAEMEAFLGGLDGRAETKVREQRVFTLASEPEWRLAVCGQGKVEAALTCQSLSDALEPRVVLLLGSATALDPAIKLGTLVLADPGIEWDFHADIPPSFRLRRPFPHVPDGRLTIGSTEAPSPGVPAVSGPEAGRKPGGNFLAGPVLSGDKDVFEPEEKAALHARYGAAALAWEGAGFHRFLRRNRKTGWELRVITEEAKEGRPTLGLLKERMATSFPALRALVRAASK
jgi:nucleoside phosphorylase